ncbi:hypothetical protein [Celeribacter halophilus]|uniref:Uncharacterized protein n=1 Tax=Celeribacter halophilus TaxID=576117 RepID=A0AAW7XT71_9RHOB|nr:hypothetical protein [Celeribacter halophilus]MBU2890165.1 hypothetical protein [Celeribacter halophilus]MDO6457225.1 hypothetical protein [Celeribacter halophilus]MDO6509942.1 hypothetical protein [Celeribacter halophilus]
MPLVTEADAELSTSAALDELDVEVLVVDWLEADVAHSIAAEITVTFANIPIGISFLS